MKRCNPIAHRMGVGCRLLREGARQSRWQHPDLETRSAVPRHAEINDHLARKICRDLGIQEP